MLEDISHPSTCESGDNGALVPVSVIELNDQEGQLGGVAKDHVANGHGYKQPETRQVEITLVPG
jgi:hypothetical protein